MPQICSCCKQKILREDSDTAQCGSCKKILHFQCFGLLTTEDVGTYKSLPHAQRALRRCVECAQRRRISLGRPGSVSEMTPLERAVTDIRADIAKKFDDLDKKLNTILTELSNLRQENTDLRSEVDVLKQENEFNGKRIVDLESKLAERDRIAELTSIEITGAPECIETNIFSNASKVLSTALNIEVVDESIAESFVLKEQKRLAVGQTERQGQNGRRNGLWIVRFTSTRVREKVLDAVRSQGRSRGWKFPSATLEGQNCTVSIRERLSSHARSIYSSAKERATECGWSFVWVRHGRVHAREREGAPVRALRTLSDVSTLINGRGENEAQQRRLHQQDDEQH
ncbi:hypothetical protein DMENIID0001_143130 [Sergentomyia squamirostris]